MKKFLTTIFLVALFYIVYSNRVDIVRYIMKNFIYKEEMLIKESNQYRKTDSWQYVQETDDFYPDNKQDILNIFYTALNGGWDEVTFYCEDEYETCLDDVKTMTEDPYLLSNINNFVSTYNSYDTIYVTTNNFGRVNIKIEKIYTEEDIVTINNKIDEIYNNLINDSMSDYEKIKTIHDYIINNTVYDQERANIVKSTGVYEKHKSNIAYGPLIEGKAICGGYTDAMALFLDKMGIPNYKVSSAKHIWNLVYIDNQWKHLDLTWDDPVVSTGENTLLYNFFLIDSNTLEDIDTSEHIYSKDIYIEAN